MRHPGGRAYLSTTRLAHTAGLHLSRRTQMAQITEQRGADLMRFVNQQQDRKRFQELNWTGTFEEYLDLVAASPRITRNAFQRIYDMIMSYGAEEFIDAKKRLIRYKFFS